MKHKMIPCHRGWIAKRTGRRRSTHLEYNSFFFPMPSGFAALPDDNGSHSRPNLAQTTNTAMSTPLQPGSRRQSKHQQLSAKEKKGKEKCGTCRRTVGLLLETQGPAAGLHWRQLAWRGCGVGTTLAFTDFFYFFIVPLVQRWAKYGPVAIFGLLSF